MDKVGGRSPVNKLSNWYGNQVKEQKTNDEAKAKERFDSEVKKFGDSVDRLTSLDSSSADLGPIEGRIMAIPKSGMIAQGLVGKTDSLVKTSSGFCLEVTDLLTQAPMSSLSHGGRSQLSEVVAGRGLLNDVETTRYEVNEGIGTVLATRGRHKNSEDFKPVGGSFAMDLNNGIITDIPRTQDQSLQGEGQIPAGDRLGPPNHRDTTPAFPRH